MAHPLERARKHEGRNLSLPEGELEELNMPMSNPGDPGYVNPRKASPKVKDNTGDKPRAKPGKNY